MKKFAAVFPGQGSQSVGMLADFMSNKVVADTYDEASAALGYDLKAITLNGPEEDLNRTEITQPAILAASVAAYRAFKAAGGPDPAAVAGHSLGEYSALVAAGALEFSDALRLVRLRGQAMQEAVPAGQGAMAAVLGVDDEIIVAVCQEVSAGDKSVWAATFNSPGQVVISGESSAVAKASEALSAKGAKRVVPLAVSAPSHCPLMQSAADKLREALGKITIKDATIPLYCNATAQAQVKATDLVQTLIAQLIGPVRWVQSVQNMGKAGVEYLLEFGPGKVLCGLQRRIDRNMGAAAVGDEASVAAALAALA